MPLMQMTPQMRPAVQPPQAGQDWSGEIQAPLYAADPADAVRPETLNFDTGLSQDAVENPVSLEERRAGSLKALLAKNVGHYIVATFLLGTDAPVSWEGLLHSVGSDYLVIFQPDTGRYVTGDIYALKFVEFQDGRGAVPPCGPCRRRDARAMW